MDIEAAEGIGVADVANTASDLELVHQVQEKDDLKAYEVLVKRYEREAFGLAYTLVGNREDAMDILQECFFKLYQAIESYRGESSFRTYFFRILVNRCRDEQRKKSVWGKIFFARSYVTETEEEESMFEGITQKTPDQQLVQTELGRKIEEEIQKLPWRQRTVFVLKFMDGMKIREIAELTDLEVGTVKAHLFHAVSKMREALNLYLAKA